MALIVKSTREGDVGERLQCFPQQSRGVFNTQRPHVFANWKTVNAPKHPCDVRRMHARDAGERRQRNRPGELECMGIREHGRAMVVHRDWKTIPSGSGGHR